MYIFFIKFNFYQFFIILHDPTSCRALIFNRAEIKAVCLSVVCKQKMKNRSAIRTCV